MASYGKLGNAALTANTYTPVYSSASTGINMTTCNINMVNTGASNATVRLAISTSTSPGAADFIEYGVILEPGDVLERTAQVLSPSEKVICWADVAGVSVRVSGMAE